MKYSLDESLRIHAAAAERMAEDAERLEVDRWFEPVREGKWSPSQIMEHLISTYDVVLNELGGGNGMKVRTKWLQRTILRLTIAPRILAGRGFPAHAPAPPELRPQGGSQRSMPEAIVLFRERASAFDEAARRAAPGQTITHAYFGKASVAEGVMICARHIEHHHEQMPAR